MMRYEMVKASFDEKNDCAVRAVANALNRPYWEIHEQFRSFGRKNFHGTSYNICLYAFKYYNIAVARPIKTRITHKQFIAANPRGSFVVMSRTHAWAIKDGVVYDSWKPGPRKQIRYIGIVKQEAV